jgi:hypothetical protein
MSFNQKLYGLRRLTKKQETLLIDSEFNVADDSKDNSKENSKENSTRFFKPNLSKIFS